MSKKRNEKRLGRKEFGKKEYLAISICLLVSVAAIVLFAGNSFGLSEESSAEQSKENGHEIIDLQSSESEEISKIDESQNVNSEDEGEYNFVSVKTEQIYRGELILVNRDRHYVFNSTDVFVNVMDFKNSKYKLGTGEESLLESTITYANSFLGDFYDISGLTNVTMINGYISSENQQAKYEKYIKSVSPEEAQKWGVKAGESDHHTGLSFNLALYPSKGVIGEGEYAWLTENAHQYGFILRYPENKSEVTKVKDANHFRYVGVPHAEYMYSEHITLEEYIALVEKTTYSEPLKMEFGNRLYTVYYYPADKTAESTEVKVPKDSEFTISGDNHSGFIVTIVE